MRKVNARKAAKKSRPANRTKQGRFVKGVSGNPHGRPGVDFQLQQRAREDAGEAYALILATMRDPDSAMKDRLWCAEWIVERGYGKAALNVSGGPLVNINMPGAGQPITDAGEAARLYAQIVGRPDLPMPALLFAPPEPSLAVDAEIVSASSDPNVAPLDEPEDPRTAPKPPDDTWERLGRDSE